MCKSRYLAEKHKGKAKYCPVLAEYCSLFVREKHSIKFVVTISADQALATDGISKFF